MTPDKQEQKWRAEPYHALGFWQVAYYTKAPNNLEDRHVVGTGLTEKQAKLIAAAAEMADALEGLYEDVLDLLTPMNETAPANDKLEDQRTMKAARLALTSAGRAPQ